MNPVNKLSPSARTTGKQADNQSGSLRWLLSFGFFLVLFAIIALLVSYGVISLKGTDSPANTANQPANQPTPSVQTSQPPVLPSGAAGHAAVSPSPKR